MRLLVLGLALGLLGSSPLDAAQADSAKTLRVGMLGSGGMDAEVLRAFARTQGLVAESQRLESVDLAISALQDGRVHVVTGVATTTALLAAVDFTNEVLPSRLVVVTRKPAAPVAFIEGLRGVKIGLVAGSPAADALAGVKLPSWNQVPGASLAAVLADLRAGKTGAAVLNIEEALGAVAQDGELQTGVFVGPRQSLAYAVRKGNVSLVGALNDHLRQLRLSPSWSGLLAREAPGLLDALGRARLDDAR